MPDSPTMSALSPSEVDEATVVHANSCGNAAQQICQHCGQPGGPSQFGLSFETARCGRRMHRQCVAEHLVICDDCASEDSVDAEGEDGDSVVQSTMSSEVQGNMLDAVYRAVAKATGWKCLHWVNADIIIEELTPQTEGSEEDVVEYLSMWTMLGIMEVRELVEGELQVCFVCQPCTP